MKVDESEWEQGQADDAVVRQWTSELFQVSVTKNGKWRARKAPCATVQLMMMTLCHFWTQKRPPPRIPAELPITIGNRCDGPVCVTRQPAGYYVPPIRDVLLAWRSISVTICYVMKMCVRGVMLSHSTRQYSCGYTYLHMFIFIFLIDAMRDARFIVFCGSWRI